MVWNCPDVQGLRQSYSSSVRILTRNGSAGNSTLPPDAANASPESRSRTRFTPAGTAIAAVFRAFVRFEATAVVRRPSR